MARTFFCCGTSANKLGRATRSATNTSAKPCTVARPFLATNTMPSHDIMHVVGVVGSAVLAATPAFATDVPGMTCAEIGSFARQVAEQRAEGVALNDAFRRLRRALGPEHTGKTEHELEKIVRAIYRMKVFATVSPEEVGNAYQAACEVG